MNMPYRKGGHWPPAQNVNHIVHSPSSILHSLFSIASRSLYKLPLYERISTLYNKVR